MCYIRKVTQAAPGVLSRGRFVERTTEVVFSHILNSVIMYLWSKRRDKWHSRLFALTKYTGGFGSSQHISISLLSLTSDRQRYRYRCVASCWVFTSKTTWGTGGRGTDRAHKIKTVLQWVGRRQSEGSGKTKKLTSASSALLLRGDFFPFRLCCNSLESIKSITCWSVWSIYCSYSALSVHVSCLNTN